MGRAQYKFDPAHCDTYVLIAGMRTTINNITDWHGFDFKNKWSSGMNYQLPFKCNLKINVQLIWHSGCLKPLTKIGAVLIKI